MSTWKRERCTKQITPFISEEMHVRLKDFAMSNQTSVSEVVRAAIDLFLSTHSTKDKQTFMSNKQSKPKTKKGKDKQAVTA